MDKGKKVSRTDLFKAHIQALLKQTMGVKVSKDKAWEVFKSIQKGVVEFVAKDEKNQLPLAGVGTYKILKSPARGKRESYKFVPRMKLYFSDAVQKYLEQFFGLADHGVELKDTGLFLTEGAEDQLTETEEPVEVASEEAEVDLVEDDEEIL
jgi:hypothetical protein